MRRLLEGGVYKRMALNSKIKIEKNHVSVQNNKALLTLVYMGYFDYLVYMGDGGQKSPPGLTVAFDFR